MNIQMFNAWYFLFLAISIGLFIGLYFLVKNKTPKTQKWTLFSLLAFALLLHFLKVLIPPYSNNLSRLYNDIWFINICAANILLFPFFFLSKSDKLKDYMFYIGVLSGIASVLYPMEPLAKVSQSSEWLDVVRFYIHHNILWYVPLLMVIFKQHKLNYKRIVFTPIIFLCVMLFIMVNQVLQSELGFIAMRGNEDAFFEIPYKNTSLIWGPENKDYAKLLTIFCPNIFKTVPVGEFAGQVKYWPWFWLIIPVFVYVIPIVFLMCLIFDWKNLVNDIKNLKIKIKERRKTKAIRK